MDMTKGMMDESYWRTHEEIRNQWTWTDYDDFDRKYGEKNNPENWSKFLLALGVYEEMGIMFKRGLFDPAMIYDQLWGYLISLWEKTEPIIFEYRSRTGGYAKLEYFEDLYYFMKEQSLGEDARYKVRFTERLSKRKSLGLKLTPFYEQKI